MSYWRDKATGRYRVQIERGGRPISRRLPQGATARDARRVEAELRLAADTQAHQVRTLADAIALHDAELRSKASYKDSKYHLLRLGPWVAEKPLTEAPAIAQDFVADCAGVYAPATLNRSLAALKRACTLAWRAGWIDTDLNTRIDLLPERNQRHEYLDHDELARIAQIDPAIADAVLIAAYSGLRLGELLALGPRSIRGELIVTDANTKTGKARGVPIAEPIREALTRLPIAFAKRTLQQRFKRAAQKLGRPDLHFHDLRHSTASLLAQVGVSLQVIGAILGHSTIQTTMRYAHLIEDSKREAIARLNPASKPSQAKKKAPKKSALSR